MRVRPWACWLANSLAGVLAFASVESACPIAARAGDIPTDVIEAADTLDLTGLQQRFETIARTVSPSVVAISAATGVPSDTPDEAHVPADLTPGKLQDILDRSTRTVGTGFVIHAGGYILTNEHVIAGAEELWVTTDDKKVYPAFVVGSDPRSDLAVLKVPEASLPPVHIAREARFVRGEWSIALGNPFGLATDGEMAMSVGVISAVDRSLPHLASKENRLYSNLIQTTAQINPGNSGGPLFDLEGDVIGINTAVILPQKQTNGIGFAIPIDARLLEKVERMEQGNEVVYGYLGLHVADPTPRERAAAGLPDDTGVCIDQIEPGTPAASSLLRPGDMIVSLETQTISDVSQFVRLVGDARVDTPVTVEWERGGKLFSTKIQPTRSLEKFAGVTRDSQRLRFRGMLVGAIPANFQIGNDKSSTGLLVLGIEEGSVLKKQGVAAGWILTSVGGMPVTCIADLMKLSNDPHSANGALAWMPQSNSAAQVTSSTEPPLSRN